jgi:hypothetical protein
MIYLLFKRGHADGLIVMIGVHQQGFESARATISQGHGAIRLTSFLLANKAKITRVEVAYTVKNDLYAIIYGISSRKLI